MTVVDALRAEITRAECGRNRAAANRSDHVFALEAGKLEGLRFALGLLTSDPDPVTPPS